jgi:hypothetical protein
MFVRTLSRVIVGMVVCVLGAAAAGGQDKDKKFEVPKNAIVGKVKTVDIKTSKFTITTKDGKDRTFAVTEKTEFWGPRGGDRGTGGKGLEDDCMEKGYEIKVVPGSDTKVAKDVYLPNRKSEVKKDKG